MAIEPKQPPLYESPLYIRWGPDRSPYAIEFKLELVDRLRAAIADALAREQEIGGVLVGLLPTEQTPTLRIEEIEFLPRRAQDGATFLLEGGSDRLAEVRRKARARERATVGLFRSHLRPGPLRPSLADRTLLASEFKDPVYALLLALGTEPYSSAFFVASNGPLPAETSIREFHLDPAEFQDLPEVEPELPKHQRAAKARSQSSLSSFATIAAVLIFVALAFSYLNQSIFSAFLPRSKDLDLALQSQDGLLRISWNQAARDFERTTDATLSIRIAGSERPQTIRLGLDELRLGAVLYGNARATVQVTLSLNGPNSDVIAEKAALWPR